jgi:hypothetical protein
VEPRRGPRERGVARGERRCRKQAEEGEAGAHSSYRIAPIAKHAAHPMPDTTSSPTTPSTTISAIRVSLDPACWTGCAGASGGG